MKKTLLMLLVLVVATFTFVACNMAVPEVSSTAINEKGELVLTYSDGTTKTFKEVEGLKQNDLEDVSLAFDGEKNLILTYPDGTTVSLGKDALPEYTVTFADHDGSVIDQKKALAGLGVEAPTAPTRENHIFAGWDKAFDTVTADMTVTATYTPMPTYTVTFKDYDGTVLKTESVVSGRDATPPAAPARTDYNFAGWQGTYTAVSENVEIVATYTQKGSYTVTFLDYNGLTLGTATVKEGESATAPTPPARDGYTFRGWSSSLSNITANKTVTAQYTLVSVANVFDIAYKLSGDAVTLTLSLAGDVSLAGFEGTLTFTGMTATAVTANSANALANLKEDGSVSIAYTSATNVTKGETVLTVTLTKTADNGTAVLSLAECFDQDFQDVSYKIVGESLKLK